MTEHLFQTDAYLRSFEARGTARDETERRERVDEIETRIQAEVSAARPIRVTRYSSKGATGMRLCIELA